MKLRNKKTGEIVDAESCNSTTGAIGIYYEEKDGSVGTKDCFYSLAELNEEWEDYKPKEPLIKNENIRKAVRAWAEANAIEDKIYCEDALTLSYSHGARFELCYRAFEDLLILTSYTIAELCGEDECSD